MDCISSWYYVTSTENPADIISRGCLLSELKESNLWFSGPVFLSNADVVLLVVVMLIGFVQILVILQRGYSI